MTKQQPMMFHLWTDPTLVPGTAKYEKYDGGWLEAAIAYHESTPVTPWPEDGPIIDIPDKVTIAMAGDWATGIEPAVDTIASLIVAENPQYTIHLGDEYYAGKMSEAQTFADLWPGGSAGSFALTSNHGMYSGGAGYLDTLANDKFAAQAGKSYFALRNTNWLIIGLDTARWTTSFLYQDGYIDDTQLAWLTKIISDNPSRDVILLSHHDGFNLKQLDSTLNKGQTGLVYKAIWNQVLPLVKDRANVYWYWGHVHCPVVYENIIHCRCIGHGGVPYIPFNLSDPTVKWIENTLANTGNPERAPNGYAVVWLDGSGIIEQIVNEYGKVQWES